MSSGSTGSLFPKWQMAILLGAPIAVGLGYLYYRNQSSKLSEESDDSGADKKKLKDKSISIDGDDKVSGTAAAAATTAAATTTAASKKVETQLEQAIRFKNDGNAKFKSGKFNEAIEMYDKAIDTCPKSNPVDLSTFYQNRAAAYEQLKKWSAVKADCTKALELNTRYVKALWRRAKANESTNDLTASLEDITATCILEGFQNNSTLVFADRVLKELGKFFFFYATQRLRDDYNNQSHLIRTGRRDAKEAFKGRDIVFPSVNFINTYFASFSNDPVFTCNLPKTSETLSGFALARASVENSQYDKVIPACAEEIESSDGEHKLEATLLRGTFLLLVGSLTEALKDFDMVIDCEDASTALKVNALIKRASLNVQSEQHQKGFEDFAAAEMLDTLSADVYHQRGQVFILLEKLEEALADFNKAAILAPNLCSAYVQKCYAEYRYALAVQNQVQVYNAIQATQKAIEMFPKNIESYNILAQILTEQQQFDKADELFEKAIALAPSHASLYVHRGLLYLQWNGDIQKALEYLNKAIEVDDKCELAYETLGTIQVQRGLLDRAVKLFEKALTLSRTEMEMVHLYSLRNAAIAQLNVAEKLGLDLSSLSALSASNAAFA